MNTLWITIIAAVVVMVFVVIGFAIGRIITGKNKLTKGCGMTPKDGNQCNVCGSSKKCEEDDKDDNDDSAPEDKQDDSR